MQEIISFLWSVVKVLGLSCLTVFLGLFLIGLIRSMFK